MRGWRWRRSMRGGSGAQWPHSCKKNIRYRLPDRSRMNWLQRAMHVLRES